MSFVHIHIWESAAAAVEKGLGAEEKKNATEEINHRLKYRSAFRFDFAEVVFADRRQSIHKSGEMEFEKIFGATKQCNIE